MSSLLKADPSDPGDSGEYHELEDGSAKSRFVQVKQVKQVKQATEDEYMESIVFRVARMEDHERLTDDFHRKCRLLWKEIDKSYELVPCCRACCQITEDTVLVVVPCKCQGQWKYVHRTCFLNERRLLSDKCRYCGTVIEAWKQEQQKTLNAWIPFFLATLAFIIVVGVCVWILFQERQRYQIILATAREMRDRHRNEWKDSNLITL